MTPSTLESLSSSWGRLTTLRPRSQWLDEIKLSLALIPQRLICQKPFSQLSPGAQGSECQGHDASQPCFPAHVGSAWPNSADHSAVLIDIGNATPLYQKPTWITWKWSHPPSLSAIGWPPPGLPNPVSPQCLKCGPRDSADEMSHSGSQPSRGVWLLPPWVDPFPITWISSIMGGPVGRTPCPR